MNTPVNLEIAKLLKEKGFNVKCRYEFNNYHSTYDNPIINRGNTYKGKEPEHIIYQAPTIGEVVMWLFDTHGIWIWVECYESDSKFIPQIPNSNLEKVLGYYNSPSEAYSAAIIYTLNNLI